MHVNNYIKLLTEIPENGISTVLKLSTSGASIPFISRYRKEQTGGLDEVEIELILKLASDFETLENRKSYILSTISEKDALSKELESKIKACFDINVLEDLYLPFKSRRQTKSELAKKSGLLGLAKLLMTQQHDDLDYLAQKFLSKSFSTTELAINGAEAIISDWVSENLIVREKLRASYLKHGVLTTKKVKDAKDITQKYKNFYDFSELIAKCPSYRLLAALRGEQEKVLRVKIQSNSEYNLEWLKRFFIKSNKASSQVIQLAIEKAYKKKLVPSLEVETKQHFKNQADEKSIRNFKKNLEQILMSPPIGAKRILAIDPGFKSGCKVVCLSENGTLLHNTTIYPHPPQKQKARAISKLSQLVETYEIEAIAIGDGTAGRETENLVKHIRFRKSVQAYVVKEDGASIYSASKVAREEFPEFDVTVRGAISIGRRLCDPLAELVKIDAKSLGVGQYQHDVNQAKLNEALGLTVEKAVNKIGVNLNTASKYLLAYVSGIGPKLASSIVEFRENNGPFRNRESLKKVKGLGEKAFEQSAGFLRIKNPENLLDDSAVHPERYQTVHRIARKNKLLIRELIGNKFVLDGLIDDEDLIKELGKFTLQDIIRELKKPGVDPRLKSKIFKFTDGIESINDLKVGMMVNGLITNVTDFGAFVNIGIKTNGLIHKTEISTEFVENPTEYLAIDQQVKAQVIQIEVERKRIALSLK